MPLPKLILALNTLSSDEWTSFKRYLKGHTRPDSDNYTCFKILDQHKGELNADFDISKIHQKHFKQMSAKGFSNMLSRLFSWFEEWFAIETFRNSDHLENLMLVKGYNRRGLYKLGDQAAKKLYKQLDRKDGLDLEENQFRAQLAYYQYYSDNPVKQKEGDRLLKEIIYSTLCHSKEFLSMLEIELVNWGRIKNLDFTTERLEIGNIKSYIPDTELNIVLNDLLLVIESNDMDSYNKIKNTLLHKQNQFNNDIHVIIFIYLLKATFSLWSEGKIKDLNRVGELYEYGFEQKLLLENNKIPSVRFLNIISILSKIYSKEWMESFITKWVNIVDSKSVITIEGLAKATTYLNTENYNLIIESLRGLEFENIFQKLRARSLELIAYYYDMNLTDDLLFSNIENHKKVLKRQKANLSQKRYGSLINLTTIIELLVKSKYKKVEIKLSSYINILYRSWVEKELTKKAKQVILA